MADYYMAIYIYINNVLYTNIFTLLNYFCDQYLVMITRSLIDIKVQYVSVLLSEKLFQCSFLLKKKL